MSQVDTEMRIPALITYLGGELRKHVRETGGETGKKGKLMMGVLMSVLPVWATGAQSCWGPSGKLWNIIHLAPLACLLLVTKHILGLEIVLRQRPGKTFLVRNCLPMNSRADPGAVVGGPGASPKESPTLLSREGGRESSKSEAGELRQQENTWSLPHVKA